MSNKIIIHIDMDAFFASVEQLLHPQYRGKPVIVGAQPDGRGVVCTASYEARKFGIHSAMPINQAYRLCPHGIFISGNSRIYNDISDQLHHVLNSFTPLVEMASIDEAFLDVTGCPSLPSNLFDLGLYVKNKIKQNLKLTASVGIASNKYVTKIASDLRKPDGLVVVPNGEEKMFLAPLPIKRLWGIGHKTLPKLKKNGIYTIGDLQALSESFLARRYGALGTRMHYLSFGIDDSPVTTHRERKSLGRETTFCEDTSDVTVLMAVLGALAQDIGDRLRIKRMRAKTVTLKLRYKNFVTITRQKSLVQPIDKDHQIYTVAKDIFLATEHNTKIRLLGITVSNLHREKYVYQTDLFSQNNEKEDKLYRSIDKIRAKYGSDSIILGSTLPNP